MEDAPKPELPAHVQSEVDFLNAIATCIINGSPIRSMIFCVLSEESIAGRPEVGSLVSMVGPNERPAGPSYPHQTMMFGKAMEDTALLNAALNVAQEAAHKAKSKATAERTPIVPVSPSRTVVAGPLPPGVEMLEPPHNETALDVNHDPII